MIGRCIRAVPKRHRAVVLDNVVTETSVGQTNDFIAHGDVLIGQLGEVSGAEIRVPVVVTVGPGQDRCKR